MNFLKRRSIAPAIIMVTSLLLSACGSGSSGSESNASSTMRPSSSPAVLSSDVSSAEASAVSSAANSSVINIGLSSSASIVASLPFSNPSSFASSAQSNSSVVLSSQNSFASSMTSRRSRSSSSISSLNSSSNFSSQSSSQSSSRNSSIPEYSVDCPAASGVQLYVSAGYAGEEKGSSSQPYKKIQTAVNALDTSNTAIINVAQGTYQESVNINNKKIHLCGGWSSNFSSRDPSIYPSIVKSPNATAIYLENVADSSVVGFTIKDSKIGVRVFAAAWPATRKDSDPLLAGNIIENNGTLSASTFSGGVLMEGGYISLAKNVIRNNRGSKGAAANLVGISALLQGNVVQSNHGGGDHGGALYLGLENAYVYNNFISGSEVGTVGKYGWGGGMILDGGQVEFKGNIWTDNYSYSHGGALFVDEGAQATMENDLFYNNRCSLEGGEAIAIDMSWNSVRAKLMATNITVVENHPCKSKSAILLETGGDLVLKNSIIWSPDGTADIHFQEGDSTVDISYSIYRRIQGAGGSNKLTEGPGKITSDPLFADPSMHDFHLKSTAGRYNPALDFWEIDTVDSPAIDAGDPSSSFAQETSPNGGRVNLGVYGGTSEASRSQ